MAKKAQPKRKKVARKGASKQSRRAVSAKKVGKSASKKTKKAANKKTKKAAKRAASRKKAKRTTTSKQVSAKKKVKGKKKSKAKAKKKVAKKASSKKKQVGKTVASKKPKARLKHASVVGRVLLKSAPKKKVLKPAISTSSSKSNARAAARANAESATSQDPIRLPEEHRKIPKTYLSAKQLREFKELLLQKRRELAGDVDHLTRDAYSKNNQGGEYSAMPIHMADIGTDNWEHEFTLGLIENEQERIREIDSALARIGVKTYGICLATHKKISIARLRAKPWAKYCIEHARAREEGRLR